MDERRGYDRLIEDKFDMIERLFVEKLDRVHDLQEQTLVQVKRTNGRVTKLELETEVVRFVLKHKWIMWGGVVLAYSITIQEVREFIFKLI